MNTDPSHWPLVAVAATVTVTATVEATHRVAGVTLDPNLRRCPPGVKLQPLTAAPHFLSSVYLWLDHVMEASFTGSRVQTRMATWEVDYPIVDLRVVEDLVAVILDPHAGPRYRQFKNLQGYSPEGKLLWTAEHPTTGTSDAYLEFVGGPGQLEAWNFACFRCQIDPHTGRLLDARFTK